MRTRLIHSLVVLMIALSLTACVSAGGSAYPLQAGLFSWNPLVVNEPDSLFADMAELNLDSLYQEFSIRDSTPDQIAEFLSTAMDEAVDVYSLDGDPHWGFDPEGKGLSDAVRQTLSINESVAEVDVRGPTAQLKGIVLDAEPYILDEWDEDPEAAMKIFIEASRKAYELARDHGLEVIICIPYYYEQNTSSELLEELIGQCCDQVAVMNYDRGGEIANLETEAEIAVNHGKGLITIYETQAPNDYYSVEVDDTYWNQGLDAVRKNYEEVQAAYPNQHISIALHDYGAIRKLLSR